LLYVYIGCLTFGIIYSAVSAILGHNGFDDGSVGDAGFEGGFDGNADGGLDGVLDGTIDVDFDGGIQAEVDGEHSVDSGDGPSPFNPLVLTSAIATFGAIGIIGKVGFKMGDLLSLIVALSFAGGIGTAIFFGIVKFMYNSQSNSIFSTRDLIGTEAEIITPIPADGMGEIALTINGIRRNFPAKSINQEDIARGVTVKVRDISGNIALVTRKITIDDLGSLETERRQSRDDREINNN
jgi:membrane protein implicated in regulation of membrane protease activity